jgi:hypothetical protein
MADLKVRDGWDKIQILLDPTGKILTALLVVLLGYYGNRALQDDQKRRAYVELLSRREEADGNLRKDMFGKVIDQFLTPKSLALEDQILNLELLAYNFHESIDLGPLLKQVYLRSWTDAHATLTQRKRLQNLAQEIVGRELVALREAGCIAQGQVRFDELEKTLVQPGFIRFDCSDKHGLASKRFVADVMTNPEATDLRKQTEVDVVLSVRPTKNRGGAVEKEEHFEFTVSPFDFPMIDNVRLGDGGRVSMVMTRVDDGGVTMALVYFPDSRTSLRDKPFHDEVLKSLDNTP